MSNEHALTIWRTSQKPIVTQAEVGAAVGTSRWWVNRLETGKCKPSVDLAAKIERLTGGAVTAKDFIQETEVAQ